MSTISRHALVPYTVAEMYRLVLDIESYPDFVPWCSGARVTSQDPDQVCASIEFARGGLHKAFTTRNRMQKDKMIEMRLVEGPFRHLEGFWRFDPKSDIGCKVSLDLEFEFSSKLLSVSFGPVFTQVANTLVDAFTKRAIDVYGQR